jgi:CubicO group peptidase (beta-lactamase class C family)
MNSSNLVSGFVAPQFLPVKKAFEENFHQHGEEGAAVSFYLNGHCVVDLWGGFANSKEKILWDSDTLTNVYSCTKGMTNLVIANLVGSGALRYDEKVSTYWPGFAQNGKADITVSQLLTHQAGLAHFERPLTLTELEAMTYGDRTSFCQFLEKQAPIWTLKPSNFGYHPLTVGFFAAELISRVDPKRRPFRVYFDEEFRSKLGLEFYLTVPSSIPSSKISRLFNDDKSAPTNSVLARNLMTQGTLTNKTFNAIVGFSPFKAKHLEIPSAIGFSTARALAQMYGAFVNNGKIDKFQLPSLGAALEEATSPGVSGFDLVRLENTIYTKGGFVIEDMTNLIGHSGLGGSAGFCDIDKKMGFGYVTSCLRKDHPDPRRKNLLDTFYHCLENQQLSKL